MKSLVLQALFLPVTVRADSFSGERANSNARCSRHSSSCPWDSVRGVHEAQAVAHRLSIVGGAIAAPFMGHIANSADAMRIGFVVPLVSFVFVALYWSRWSRLCRLDS